MACDTRRILQTILHPRERQPSKFFFWELGWRHHSRIIWTKRGKGRRDKGTGKEYCFDLQRKKVPPDDDLHDVSVFHIVKRFFAFPQNTWTHKINRHDNRWLNETSRRTRFLRNLCERIISQRLALTTPMTSYHLSLTRNFDKLSTARESRCRIYPYD